MNVRFENISFAYDSKYILKDFNLEIKDGQMIALIGHNGSGKSTLAKLMMGLLEPSKGCIYINDTKLTEESVGELRNHMGIIFQNPDNQFVGVTVKDDIAFGLENRCVPKEEMEEKISKYLELVGMTGYDNYNPEELSGGQKQRVAIAGALAMNSELMIFDESTSMLDPICTKEVIEMIKQIKNQEHKTIIVITHNLEEVTFADRVVVLNGGKIVGDGVPEEVFKNRELLEACGLKTMDSYAIIDDLKNKDYKNKKEIEAVLWESTFKM